jgi:hypothetical protein
LAGAIWTGDDRSHGVRHPGARVPLWVGPEVIEDGVTGKVVDSEEEAIAALPAILSYDRHAVRQRFEERFTNARMAKDYVSIYRQLSKMRARPTAGCGGPDRTNWISMAAMA